MKIYIKIDGMHCTHCEETIRNALLQIKNIKEVTFLKSIACITYENNIDKEEIINKIIDNGYITKKEYISNNINDLKPNLIELLIITITIILSLYILYKIIGINIFNLIPTIDSNITYLMLFITGFFTSIHCISMCGAINLLVVNKKNHLKSSILYNLGRIISYTIIGTLVGLIGSILSINETITGIITIIASIIMLFLALSMLGIIKKKTLFKIYLKTNNKNPFIIGLLNGLMPCGPLQAMQIYALETGSLIKGAFSMLIFGLGTVPLMFLISIVFKIVKGKTKIIINKISSILIILLSFTMLNRGLLYLNIDCFKIFEKDFVTSTIQENYQIIEFDLSYDNYQNITLIKDIPVRMIIHVQKKYLTGCNNKIIIKEFNVEKELQEGDNIIEFTPTKTGNFTYTCFMNMIKNTIKVKEEK